MEWILGCRGRSPGVASGDGNEEPAAVHRPGSAPAWEPERCGKQVGGSPGFMFGPCHSGAQQRHARQCLTVDRVRDIRGGGAPGRGFSTDMTHNTPRSSHSTGIGVSPAILVEQGLGDPRALALRRAASPGLFYPHLRLLVFFPTSTVFLATTDYGTRSRLSQSHHLRPRHRAI